MNYNKCTTATNDQKIVVEENRSKMLIKNPQRRSVHKIQVDGCLILEDQEKCDWLVATTEAPLVAIYIELKGCDINKAVSQLKNTIKITKSSFNNHEKKCYAVTTRIPKHGTDIRKMMIDFFKETKATLSVKNLNNDIEI